LEEIRASVPHPDAYYCPKDNGWVIISWGFSAFHPPLARSFEASPHPPLPKHSRRHSKNCADSTENKAHHFHKYERAVDAHKLSVPFRVGQWDTIETVKHKRRVGTILPDELDLEKVAVEEEDKMDVDEEEGPLLDLYVCCQCTFHCLRSPVISGVVPQPLWDEFLRDKQSNPQPGKTAERSVAMAMETLLM
jgi:ubiquitin carboxyl-terminal hydrolase 25/28